MVGLDIGLSIFKGRQDRLVYLLKGLVHQVLPHFKILQLYPIKGDRVVTQGLIPPQAHILDNGRYGLFDIVILLAQLQLLSIEQGRNFLIASA